MVRRHTPHTYQEYATCCARRGHLLSLSRTSPWFSPSRPRGRSCFECIDIHILTCDPLPLPKSHSLSHPLTHSVSLSHTRHHAQDKTSLHELASEVAWLPTLLTSQPRARTAQLSSCRPIFSPPIAGIRGGSAPGHIRVGPRAMPSRSSVSRSAGQRYRPSQGRFTRCQ